MDISVTHYFNDSAQLEILDINLYFVYQNINLKSTRSFVYDFLFPYHFPYSTASYSEVNHDSIYDEYIARRLHFSHAQAV